MNISLILVFDQLWISGQILVNLQEQAAQHNPFLNIQTRRNPLFDARPDVTHGVLAPVTLLGHVHP